MTRHFFIAFFSFFFFFTRAQCPQIYNYLGVLSSKPYFINCTGGSYAVNIQSNSSWGTYTLNWGDNTIATTGSTYSASSLISHTYASTVDTFVVTLTIPSSTCVMTGIVVMEKPVNASIQVPTLGITQACAPKTLTFSNSSTDVSATTTFTWNFGDGTPDVVYSYTNQGQSVTHLYQKNTVNCQTQVTLRARNYCSFGNPTIANFNPIQIYDVDNAQVTPDKILRCWPDNNFTFVNSTSRNCLSQGNTFQRQEWWNFGNYWGKGHDSIINWSPWPPSAAHTVSYSSIGSYTVMLRDSNLCGVDTAIILVGIVNPPTAAIVSPTNSICQGSSITFTNNSTPGFNYKWNSGLGGGFVNLGTGNKTFTYTTPGTYTVKLVALINGAGGSCQDTAVTTLTVFAAPVADFTMSPVIACQSIVTTYTDLSNGAAQWNWTFDNGTSSTLQAPPPQTFTTVGIHVATLVVTATTTCVKTKTLSVEVKPNPTAAFTQFTACAQFPVTFTNNSVANGADPILSYTWAYGDGNPTTSSTTPAHTYSTQGTYTVHLRVATAYCSDSIIRPIQVNVKPTASFVITPTIGCPTFTPQFTNASQNAQNYTWYSGTVPGNTSTATNPVFSYSNATAGVLQYTVKLIATSGGGCVDSLKRVISVKSKPVAGFTMNTAAGCSPLTTTFTNTSTGYLTSGWLFGDGGNSALNNPVHTYSNGTLFTKTVTAQLVVTSSLNCVDTVRHNLTIYAEALPNFTITPPAGCSPLVVGFNSVPGVATYTWTHGDGTPIYTTTTSHSYTYVNATNVNTILTVSLQAQTSNGCFGSSSNTVAIFHRPIANFTANTSGGCSPYTVGFINTSTGNDLNRWSLGSGTVSTLRDPSVTYTSSPGSAAKNYTVKLVVTTNEGCQDSIEKMQTLFALPRADFAADTPACTPRTVSFSNLSVGANTYTWNFGDGAASTSSLASPKYYYVNNTSLDKKYNVRLTAFNPDGCSDSKEMMITIHKKPNFFIVSHPDSGCSPLNVNFAKVDGAIQANWSSNGVPFGSNGAFASSFENKGGVSQTYLIQMIARDQFNCIDTATKTIKVFNVPKAQFNASPLNVFVPIQSTFFNNLSTGATTFTWSFGDGSSSHERSPSYTYTKPGEYQIILIAKNNKNCTDTFTLPDKIIAQEETSIQIPNAFTPNASGSTGRKYDPSDLSNDIFHPVVKGTDRYQLSIYTRWGELVFDTRDPEEGWDGYYKGKLCTQDIYIWKITATFLDGKVFTKSGDVLLMK